MVVTNVCELLIYAGESKEYCGEPLKLSTEHNKYLYAMKHTNNCKRLRITQ